MVRASHWVGLTLPGMIELPGSLAGRISSPMPQRGPLPSQRTSLAIFISAMARPRRAADRATSPSWAASASNLLGALVKGRPVMAAMRADTRSAYSGWVFSPVPTAVPPMASSYTWGRAASTWSRAWSSWLTQPEISWPRVSGVASCRCVRPIFTRSAAGRRWPTVSVAAAMCMAVGNVSLLDCPLLTSSLGCTGCLAPSSPPASSMARLAMTSLAFMLVWVPEPVWKTTSGKCSSRAPSMTSWAARTISSARSAGSRPSSALTSAAARLSTPRAPIMGRVKRRSPMRKFFSERWVWAPQ